MRFLLVIAPLLFLIQPFHDGPGVGASEASTNSTLDDLSIDQLDEKLSLAYRQVYDARVKLDVAKDELRKKEEKMAVLNGDFAQKKEKWERLDGEEREKNKIWYEEKGKEMKAGSEAETAKRQFSSAESELKKDEDAVSGIRSQLEEAKKVLIEIGERKAQLAEAQRDLASLKAPKTQDKITDMEINQLFGISNPSDDIGQSIDLMDHCEKDTLSEICVQNNKALARLRGELTEAKQELPKAEAEIQAFYGYPEKHATMKSRVDALQKAVENIPTDLFKAKKTMVELEIEEGKALGRKYLAHISKCKDQKTLFEKETAHKEAKDKLDATPRDIKVYNDAINAKNNMELVAREANSTKQEVEKMKENLSELQNDWETKNNRANTVKERKTIRAESLKLEQQKKAKEASTPSSGFPFWIIGVVFGVLIVAAGIYGAVSWRNRKRKAAGNGPGAKNLPPSSANEEQASGGSKKSDKANRLPIG